MGTILQVFRFFLNSDGLYPKYLLYFISQTLEKDPNPALKYEIYENFNRIALELHFFLYILPLLTQDFYFLTRCR